MTPERFKLVPSVYAMFLRENLILLLHRASTGWMDNHWGLVAGHVERDEMATNAMIREAKEEVGISLTQNNLEFVHVMQRIKEDDQRIDIFFTIQNWQGEPHNTEPDKHDELKWFPIDQLPENTIPSIKHVIEHVQTGKLFSEFVGN